MANSDRSQIYTLIIYGPSGKIPLCTSSLYIFIPDRCDNFLTISTDEMAVMEGDVISVRTAILQRPHSGISLMVNGSDALTSSNFDCTSPSNVLSNEVVYNCTPRSVGMTSVQGHTIFCDVDCYSQQLLVEIKSEKIVVYCIEGNFTSFFHQVT